MKYLDLDSGDLLVEAALDPPLKKRMSKKHIVKPKILGDIYLYQYTIILMLKKETLYQVNPCKLYFFAPL